jgi:hypothetical protein
MATNNRFMASLSRSRAHAKLALGGEARKATCGDL